MQESGRQQLMFSLRRISGFPGVINEKYVKTFAFKIPGWSEH